VSKQCLSSLGLVGHVTWPVTLSKSEAQVALSGGMNPLSDVSAGIKINVGGGGSPPGDPMESVLFLLCAHFAQQSSITNFAHLCEDERQGCFSTQMKQLNQKLLKKTLTSVRGRSIVHSKRDLRLL